MSHYMKQKSECIIETNTIPDKLQQIDGILIMQPDLEVAFLGHDMVRAWNCNMDLSEKKQQNVG